MKKTLKLLVFTFLITFYSCSQSENAKEVVVENRSNVMSKSFAATATSAPESKVETDVAEANNAEGRKIIKDGQIRFETSNSGETENIIVKSIASYNGYISSDNISNYNEQIEHSITIRVPAGKFDALLEGISRNAKNLESKNITVSDVTEEFIDVESRIKTKRALESKYEELLKQAKKVQDILEIEKEMGTLRTEIESVEGRLKYLKDRVNFSTLTVVFYEKTNTALVFTSKMKEAVKNGWKNLQLFIITLVSSWPFILILLVIFSIIRQVYNRKKMKKVI